MEVGARLFKIFKQSWNVPFFKKVVLAVECTINKEIFSREISFEADASMTRLIYIGDLCAQRRVKSTEYNIKSLWFQEEEKWKKLVNLMVRRSLINFGKFSGEWRKVSWDDSTGVKQRKVTWWQFEGLRLLSCWLVCRTWDERRWKEWKSRRGGEQTAKMQAWSHQA